MAFKSALILKNGFYLIHYKKSNVVGSNFRGLILTSKFTLSVKFEKSPAL
jgi:hypothetical protein